MLGGLALLAGLVGGGPLAGEEPVAVGVVEGVVEGVPAGSAEQVALAAIGAATVSAPGLPLNYALGTDLPRVIALIGHAPAVGGAPACPQ